MKFIKSMYDLPEQKEIITMPEVYTKRALKLGLGLPPSKEVFITNNDYGAKCMLLGYNFAKKKYKKKYKKQLKKLRAELKAANNTPFDVLKEIDDNDVREISFAFEPMQQDEGD